MMHAKALIAGVALLASSVAAPAAPNDDTGDDWAQSSGEIQTICLSHGVAAQLACTAFLRGAFEGLMVGEANDDDDGASFCPPDEGVALPALRQTFLDFVAGEPDRRAEDAGRSLLTSLEDRYPCDDDLTSEIAAATPRASFDRKGLT
jgi:hypothetical protein